MKNILVIAVLVLVVPASLNAQEVAHSNRASSTVEAELVSLTDAWTEAINGTKLEELMAPDFALHAWDDSWSVERATWLDNLFAHIDIAEYHHSAIVAHVYGDVAAITSKYYWRGKRGTTSEKKPFEEHGYVLDVWRRNGGRWQVVSRVTIVIPGKEEAGS